MQDVTDQASGRNIILENLKIIRDVNKVLEFKVKERTEEIEKKNEELIRYNAALSSQEIEIKSQNEELTQQQQEIGSQRDLLSIQNIELLKSKDLIERKNFEIEKKNETLEYEIKDRTKELIDYNQQLEQFAFITAHNLRSPIARILGLGR